MQIEVNNDKLELIEEVDLANSGSVNYYEVDINFNSSWDNLTKVVKLINEKEEEGRDLPVVNNKIYIDSDNEGSYCVGLVGYLLVYELTSDTALNANKKYYTRSGVEGSYVYTEVAEPNIADINTYYEAIITYQISTNLKRLYINKGAAQIKTAQKEVPSPEIWQIYISEIQNLVNQTNQYKDDTSTFKNQAKDYKDETEVLKNTTLNYKNETEQFKNEAQDLVSAVTFSTFGIDFESGEIYIETPEKLENAGFFLNRETGELEVGYNE